MLKSVELKQKAQELQAKMDAKIEAKEEVTDAEKAELQAALDAYDAALKAEESQKSNKKGEPKMDKKEFVNAFKKYLATNDTSALQAIDAASGNNGAVSVDGGALVPEELLGLAENNAETVDLRSIVTTVVVGTRTGRVPTIDYGQKIALTNFDENAAIPQAKAVFGSVPFTLASKGALIPVSRELIMDANTDVLSIIGKLFGVVYAKSVASAILTAAQGANAAKATVANLATKAGIDVIKKAVIALPLASIANASVVMNQNTWAAMATAADNQGRYLLARDANNDTVKMIEGRPVVVVDNDCLADDTVIVGNFKAVYHVAYPDLEVMTDASAGFGTNSVMVRAICRFADINTYDKAFAVITKGA